MTLGPLLVANRGEIAVRVVRTAQAVGLATVAVFTEADLGALHVDVADTAVQIGSYLDPDALVDAALRSGARSVHPGYGFLSENAEFAQAVIEAGLVWIGPPPAAIELMGDKSRAKQTARAAGVPVVPGIEGDDIDLRQLEDFCSENGFPVVIKALAGGGGKGMRVVRGTEEIEPALDAARRESRNAFGDDRVLVERYLERPRHIEVQVLADRHGHTVYVGERECSLQRRHQKVVEEAPSPVVDPALRARMGEAAVALAQACGYESAGTVEFIAPKDAHEFFFLEMNTRLQVEHPVTELVYGLDLVEQQLRIAADEPLTLRQADLAPVGHAIEARIYAEDPSHGFLPSIGTVRAYREPTGPGVRVDSGLRVGTEVSTAYDPMLAKVIAHGPDRAIALARLDRALAGFTLVGVSTNAAFTRGLVAREDVQRGEQDTGLLERVLADLATEPPPDLVPAAMLVAAGSAHPAGPWRRCLAEYGETRVGNGRVTVGERSWEGGVRFIDESTARISLDGIERRYSFAISPEAVWIVRDGHHMELRTEAVARHGAAGLAGSLTAPMPGTVLLVQVSNGDKVEEGAVLMVLESMKMELSIVAPQAGTVHGLELSPGDRVALGQRLLAVLATEEGKP